MKHVIMMDTREKIDHKQHITGYFDRNGIQYVRNKLYVGDYARLDNMTVCVDVKQGLQEVYNNVIHDRDRFRREADRALAAGIRLIVLVEEAGVEDLEGVANWINPRITEYQRARPDRRPPVSSKSLAKIMRTMSENHGIEWRFCCRSETGRRICELLEVNVE